MDNSDTFKFRIFDLEFSGFPLGLLSFNPRPLKRDKNLKHNFDKPCELKLLHPYSLFGGAGENKSVFEWFCLFVFLFINLEFRSQHTHTLNNSPRLWRCSKFSGRNTTSSNEKRQAHGLQNPNQISSCLRTAPKEMTWRTPLLLRTWPGPS